jgi:hypothetical protein
MGHQSIRTLNYPVTRPRRVARAHVTIWPRSTGAVVLAGVAIAGLCLLYLWQGVMILDLTARYTSSQASWIESEEVNRWLEFQIDKAFSLERISRLAHDQLHMVEPTDIRYVYLATAPDEP